MQYNFCGSVKNCGTNDKGGYSYACVWDDANKLCKDSSSSAYNPKIVCK